MVCMQCHPGSTPPTNVIRHIETFLHKCYKCSLIPKAIVGFNPSHYEIVLTIVFSIHLNIHSSAWVSDYLVCPELELVYIKFPFLC